MSEYPKSKEPAPLARGYYVGDAVEEYEERRTKEPKWEKEQLLVREFISRLPDSATIIDIPVGTGRFLDFYLERELSVFGIDISLDMLKKASTRVPPGEKAVRFVHGDAEALGLPDKSCDYAICARLANLIPLDSVERVLRELSRVVRGEILFEVRIQQDLKGLGWRLARAGLRHPLRTIQATVATLRRRYARNLRRVARPPVIVHKQDDFHARVLQAGLTIRDCLEVDESNSSLGALRRPLYFYVLAPGVEP